MRILTIILSLYLSLFAANSIYAANTTLTTDYPSPSGSYNKVVISPPAGYTPPCNATNIGLLFYSGNALELCALVKVSATNTLTPEVVPASQTCFNRFWQGPAAAPAFGCPAGYTQGQMGGTAITDNFTNGSYTVKSTVCCTSGASSPILPT